MTLFSKEDIFLVTGASSGIGRQTAIDLIKEGATVVGIARNKEKLENTKQMSICPERFFIEIKDFSKNLEDICGWVHKYASIQMLTGKTPIDMDHIDETKIVSMMGEVDSKYYHRYSDYTGYLWTEEEFKCGGHDLLKILESHLGEYIHIEIELYNKK